MRWLRRVWRGVWPWLALAVEVQRDRWHHTDQRDPAMTARNPFGLTNREDEVVTRVGRGMTDWQIADDLGIAPSTTRVHVRAAMAKMQVRTRAQLAAKWLRDVEFERWLARRARAAREAREAARRSRASASDGTPAPSSASTREGLR